MKMSFPYEYVPRTVNEESGKRKPSTENQLKENNKGKRQGKMITFSIANSFQKEASLKLLTSSYVLF